MNIKTEPTFWAHIYMAGDIDTARCACRQFCRTGLCVTVTPTDYIYTGGAESGFVIGLINYPRFPSTPDEIIARATDLATLLLDHCCQDSYTIMTPDKTIWMTTRE